jgi:hypothetical protein
MAQDGSRDSKPGVGPKDITERVLREQEQGDQVEEEVEQARFCLRCEQLTIQCQCPKEG